MSTSHTTPRVTLFSTTFWEILPSHYDKILKRWTKIAHLHHEAKSDILAADRTGAVESIKVELEMLDQDVEEYRKLVNGVDITDIAGVYMVGGKSRHRALEIAKEDKKDLEESLSLVEEQVNDIRVDDRADRILTWLYLLWQLDEEFAEIQKGLERQEYIDLICFNIEKMEADLEVIQQNNKLLNDDRLFD
ncbi:hypothetical protein G6011_03485 [Alternaria panax]|uniref:Uncharacterized protein n=1 Tax=Alternaria panax TaxID=48097 RepID=A0AAD4NU32_9PLEO|nr:hypothetical protein G6011_03485 [Alternaria panax]